MGIGTIGPLNAPVHPGLHRILRRRCTESKEKDISVLAGILQCTLRYRRHGAIGRAGLLLQDQPCQCDHTDRSADQYQREPDQRQDHDD